MTATIAPEPVLAPPRLTEDDVVPSKPSSRAWLKSTLVVLAYIAIALLAFWPYGPLDATHLPGAIRHSPAGADPYQMTWFLAWFPYAVSHGLNIFQTTRFEYPFGANLADNTMVPLLGFIAWPITANLGPVAAFNFLIRLCFALDAVSMFFVLRHYTRSFLAPFLGGLLYAFGPYTAAQELHIDLIFVPIPPLLVLCADELVNRQRMRPVRLGLIMGLLMTAQLLVSPDILAGCGVLLVAGIVGLAVAFRDRLRARVPYAAKALAVALTAFGVTSGYMLWEMVSGPRHLVGPVIPARSLQVIRADIISPIVPTSNQLLVPHLISRFGDHLVAGNLSESGTYLGIPLLILLVVILRRLWGDPTVRVFSLLAALALFISLGPSLSFGTRSLHIPLPEAVFQKIPLLDNTIPARYSLYVLLFVSMVVAIGLDRLWVGKLGVRALLRSWLRKPKADADLQVLTDPLPSPSPRLRRWLGPLGGDSPLQRVARVGVAGVIVVVSLLPAAPFLSRRLGWPSTLAPAIARTVPAGTVVLTYPYATPKHPAGMVWQATDQMRFKLLGGYANIAVDGVDQRWPVLLTPQYPQDRLSYSSDGDRFPPPGPATRADEAALLALLKEYHVGAVVYWRGGGDPIAAYNYLRAALGSPTVSEPQFAIWLPTGGRWGHARIIRAGG